MRLSASQTDTHGHHNLTQMEFSSVCVQIVPNPAPNDRVLMQDGMELNVSPFPNMYVIIFQS